MKNGPVTAFEEPLGAKLARLELLKSKKSFVLNGLLCVAMAVEEIQEIAKALTGQEVKPSDKGDVSFVFGFAPNVGVIFATSGAIEEQIDQLKSGMTQAELQRPLSGLVQA